MRVQRHERRIHSDECYHLLRALQGKHVPVRCISLSFNFAVSTTVTCLPVHAWSRLPKNSFNVYTHRSSLTVRGTWTELTTCDTGGEKSNTFFHPGPKGFLPSFWGVDKRYHRTVEWFGWKGTFKIISLQPPCPWQWHLPLDQVS